MKEGFGNLPSDGPIHRGIRAGFVYERVPHITLKGPSPTTPRSTWNSGDPPFQPSGVIAGRNLPKSRRLKPFPSRERQGQIRTSSTRIWPWRAGHESDARAERGGPGDRQVKGLREIVFIHDLKKAAAERLPRLRGSPGCDRKTVRKLFSDFWGLEAPVLRPAPAARAGHRALRERYLHDGFRPSPVERGAVSSWREIREMGY